MKIAKANLILAGRILYGFILLNFGYSHFAGTAMLAQYVPKYIPGEPTYWVYFTGVCFIIAGISIIINKGAWAAGVGIAAMLGVFITTIDIPATYLNPLGISNLLKDTAIAAGALIIAGLDSSLDSVEATENPSEIISKKRR